MMFRPGRNPRRTSLLKAHSDASPSLLSIKCARDNGLLRGFLRLAQVFRSTNSTLLSKGAVLVVALLLVPGSVLLAVLKTPAHTNAAPSTFLNFQGRLLTNTGALVPDGYYNIEFKLFDASTSSGSSQGSCAGDSNCKWVETYYDSNGVTAGNDNRLRVVNGYFSVKLGSLTAFSGINWDQQMWLTMNVGGSTQTATPTYDGEMSPRVQLTAVPLAFVANNVNSGSQSANSTNSNNVSIQSGNATGLTSNSGNITIDAGTATGTAGTISLGAINASAIALGRNGITTTNSGALTVSQILTGNLGLAITGATADINASSNFATNINTSGSTGSVSIGNSVAGAITLQSGSNITIGTSDTTGTLLVLDTKTGAGDPTGVDGAIYYNSSSGTFRCFQASAWIGCIAPGSGDSITVNSTTAIDANFLNTAASSSVAGTTFAINTASNPDDITLTVSDASGTLAGVVTANSQTFGGDKTFNGLITGALGATITGATTSINASSNFVTNINTGTSTGAVSIGNTAAGALALQSGSSITLDGVAGTTVILGSTTQTGQITIGQSTATNTISIGGNNTGTGNTQTINIGAGTPAGTGLTAITLGNTTNTSSLLLRAGTGDIIARTADLFVVQTSGSTSIVTVNTSATATIVSTFAGTLTANAVQSGIGVTTTFTPTTDGNRSYYGVNSNPTFTGSADNFDTVSFVGVRSLPAYTPGSGRLGNMIGGQFSVSNTSNRTVNSGYGIQVNTFTDTNTKIASQAGIAIQALNSGQLGTETSLLMLGTITIPAGDFSIYNSSTLNNVFAGSLRVGSTVAPTVALDVTGAGLISSTLGVSGLLTANLGATVLGATTSINASSNFATNINTGTSTGAVSIGNSLAGAITLQSGSNITLGTSDITGTLLVLDTKTGSGDPTGVDGGMYYNSATEQFRCYQKGAWTGCLDNRVILGSDVANSNASADTIADVTGLSFAVTSGVRYHYRFVINYTAAATTTGSRWTINGPTTTELSYTSTYALTATSNTDNNAVAYDTPGASNASSANTAGNMAIIEGTITPSANGTLIARFASEVSSSAITAKAGSYVQFWRE